jgi:hypothetical protein
MMSYGYYGGGMWILGLVMATLLVVPFWRILPRHGIPNWVALAAIIPLGALILLWVVAFKDKISGDS